MNIKDLSPIDEPVIGKIITEFIPIDGLKNCGLYVLPSDAESMAKNAAAVLSMLVKHMGKMKFLNHYFIEQLEEMPSFDSAPSLKQAIDKEKPTFLMPLNTLSREEQWFLIVRSEKEGLTKDIPLMLYTSERITKKSMIDLMIQHAVQDSEVFFSKIERTWASEILLKTLSEDQAGCSSSPSFGMATSKNIHKSVSGESRLLTHQKEISLQEHLVESINAYKEDREDEKAYANLQLLFSTIPNEDIINYFATLPLEELKRLQSFVSVQQLAKKSKIKIEIRRIGRTNRHKPTDGHFRIFFKKEDKEEQLHFHRRSSLILYLVYLLDIVKNEVVDSLNLKTYESMFKSLFIDVYGYDDGTQYFKTLFGKGTSEQQLLRHCYSDIRATVSKICKSLNESPSPFIISDTSSHLHVLKENILIDKRLFKYL